MAFEGFWAIFRKDSLELIQISLIAVLGITRFSTLVTELMRGGAGGDTEDSCACVRCVFHDCSHVETALTS